MQWSWYITAGILLAYSVRIFSYLAGWRNILRKQLSSEVPLLKVSVVIPFRNEEKSLPHLLENLASQNYPADKFEVILVDDHSGDKSATGVEKYIHQFDNYRLLSLGEGQGGKKDALQLGIRMAYGSIILTSDADCRMGPGWIREMIRCFAQPDVHMVLGTVILEPAGGIFRKMQCLEFFSLIATAAGAAGVGRPILSNAANLAFQRKDYLEYLKDDIRRSPSGDDMFLMLWIKKKWPGSICFAPSHEAIVRTPPKNSTGDFLNQRIRWASKNRFYRDRDVIITASLVYLANACLLVALVAGFFQAVAFWLLLALFLVKSLTDLAILSAVLDYYRRRKLLWLFLPLEIIYFVYVSITGLAGLVIPYSWKGRKVRPHRKQTKQDMI